jgi:hypothetical protein
MSLVQTGMRPARGVMSITGEQSPQHKEQNDEAVNV